jgi:hypothetical protein
LESIGAEQFERVFNALEPALEIKRANALPDPAPAPAPRAAPAAPQEGLLLKDATLEDIVRHLHAMNIEPTFRHLIR